MAMQIWQCWSRAYMPPPYNKPTTINFFQFDRPSRRVSAYSVAARFNTFIYADRLLIPQFRAPLNGDARRNGKLEPRPAPRRTKRAAQASLCGATPHRLLSRNPRCRPLPWRRYRVFARQALAYGDPSLAPPRRRGASACRGRRRRKDWIPAFAGMTRRVAARQTLLAPIGLRSGTGSSP